MLCETQTTRCVNKYERLAAVVAPVYRPVLTPA